MPRVRHRSRDELPPAPLAFADPLSVPDETVLGAVLLHEVPAPFALHAFQALRAVFAWAAGPDASAGLFDAAAMAAWEEDVLRTEGVDEALWAPVSVIVGELARPADTDPESLANACLAAADWAFGARAEGTALLFAEAAAAAWPSNARIAWLAGRFHRERLQLGRAEMWFRRASRVAVWTGDWELQARALNSLGNLKVHLGDLPGGREILLSASRLAKRKRLRECQGMVHHDLFVVSTYSGDLRTAELHAEQAFTGYGADHANVPNLAFDIAHFWIEKGQFARAFDVLCALEGSFVDDDRRVRVLASTARAAGALGEADTFDGAWSSAWELLDSGSVEHLRSAVGLELGLGALNMARRGDAERALTMAREAARATREGETLARAESALDSLHHHLGRARETGIRRRGRGGTDLASRLVASLTASAGERDRKGARV